MGRVRFPDSGTNIPYAGRVPGLPADVTVVADVRP